MISTAPERLRGIVDEWFAEEGWGRLRSAQLDGLVFAHFSAISDQSGFRSLQKGQPVTFTWESGEQDGCRFRATDVRSDPEGAVEPPSEQPRHAYRSSLRIDGQAPPEP